MNKKTGKYIVSVLLLSAVGLISNDVFADIDILGGSGQVNLTYYRGLAPVLLMLIFLSFNVGTNGSAYDQAVSTFNFQNCENISPISLTIHADNPLNTTAGISYVGEGYVASLDSNDISGRLILVVSMVH